MLERVLFFRLLEVLISCSLYLTMLGKGLLLKTGKVFAKPRIVVHLEKYGLFHISSMTLGLLD